MVEKNNLGWRNFAQRCSARSFWVFLLVFWWNFATVTNKKEHKKIFIKKMLKNDKKCLTKFLKCANIFLDARKGASVWKGRTNKKYILKGV